MKQLYATGTLSRQPGPAVKATSAGVQPDELDAALPSLAYTPPPAKADGRPLPVRLSLLNTPAGRVLTHVAPNGGSYFAHALLDVPSTADAQLAIQTWGSPQWQRHEPDSANRLPELPYLPVADVLDDAALRDWLTEAAHREAVAFVLTALLGTPSGTRIVLAASTDAVAKVVYGVTRALPAGLLDDFTFSTYEPDPCACSARLVGYDGGADDWDLPAACYGGNSVGFNPATGKRSELAAAPFAAFAVAALVAGDHGPLDDLKATWEGLGLAGPREFDLVFRLSHGTGVLTREEAVEALRHPPLAAWVANKSEVLNHLLDWALDDRTFATASFSRAVQAVRAKADVVARLGQTVRDRGLSALRTGDRERAATALEVVLPVVQPAKANAVWGDVLAQVPEPDSLSWDVRGYLLPRLVRFKQQSGTAGVDPALLKWLDLPADRLGELLSLELPRAYQLAAGRSCLSRSSEPEGELVRTLAAHPTVALALLLPDDPDRSVALFAALLAEAPAHPWFEDVLARASEYPPALLNRFFEAALSAGKVNADHLIRTQGPRVLELFAGQSGLDRVGSLLLSDPPADLLRSEGLLDFLNKLLHEPQVGDVVKDRVRAVRRVRAYFDSPTFEPAAMTDLSAALAVTPPVVPAATRRELFDLVTDVYAKRAKGDTARAELEAILTHFGDVLAGGPTDLYENLLRELRARTDFGRNADLVHTFLALALGAARSPELVAALDGLDGHAFAVASDAARRGGNRLLNEIDRRSADWPKAARAQWGFLLTAVRPEGFGRVLRNAGYFLAGGVAATAAWWAMKLFDVLP